MSSKIFSEEIIRKVLRNKNRLERKLKVKIKIKDYEINFEGEEAKVFVAERVLEAIDKDFIVVTALLLVEEDYVLEEINIKDVTKKKNLEQIRGRIIGTQGKTLKTLSDLTECHITLHDNTVSLIGPAEKMKDAVTSVEILIRGSKQSNVYKYLERQRKKVLPKDFGLKE